MDKTYIKLFSELARAIDLLSERVYEYDMKKDDEKGAQAAEKMRNEFHALNEKLNSNEVKLERTDYAKLLIGAAIETQNLEKQLEMTKKAIDGYKIDIMPKLQRIIDETSNEEEAENLANEIFSNV